MKIRIPEVSSVNFWLLLSLIMSFILEIMVQVGILVDSSWTKASQYVVLLLPVLFCFIQTIVNKINDGHNYVYEYEIKNGGVLASVFLLSTLWQSYTVGRFTSNSLLGIIQIFLPFIITFVVLNYISEDNLDLFMIIALIIVVIALLCNEGENLIILSNYTKISFFNSTSPFENNIFPQFAAPLGVYFIYNKEKHPIMLALVLFINLLIFKRVLIIMLLILYGIKVFKLEDIYIKKNIFLYALIWFIIVRFTYYMYLPENSIYFEQLLHIDFADFTMARIYRFWFVLERGFVSYGLGSTSAFLSKMNLSYIGVDFELDFIRVMFELGSLSVATYIFIMLRICRQNLYSIAVISMYFLNYLMANGMFQYWSVTLILITIAYINKKNGMLSN